MFELVGILVAEPFEIVNVEKVIKNENNLDVNELMESYKNFKFSQRIEHIFKSYPLQKSRDQNKRIHCVKLSNDLLEIYLFHKASNEKKVELKIWNSLNYASNHNILLILHHFIGCLLSFHTQGSAINLIFDSLQLLSSKYSENIDKVEDVIRKFVVSIKQMVKSNEALFKCKLIIKYFAISLFSIDCKMRAEIERILDEPLWICVQDTMRNRNIDSTSALVTKCMQSLLNSNNVLKDPYVCRLESRDIARGCIHSIIDGV